MGSETARIHSGVLQEAVLRDGPITKGMWPSCRRSCTITFPTFLCWTHSIAMSIANVVRLLRESGGVSQFVSVLSDQQRSCSPSRQKYHSSCPTRSDDRSLAMVIVSSGLTVTGHDRIGLVLLEFIRPNNRLCRMCDVA